MMYRLQLNGMWGFLEDQKQQFTGFPPKSDLFKEAISLPGTTAMSKKGKINEARETGHLTELYPYCGTAWFRRVVEIPEHCRGKIPVLYLERTRVTTLWVNGVRIGSQNSLCTPHIYELPEFAGAATLELCIAVDNSHYPTGGGHMTSPDTQTNWNGITGEISLRFYDANCITRIKAIPDVQKRKVTLHMRTKGTINLLKITGSWESEEGIVGEIPQQLLSVQHEDNGSCTVTVFLGDDAPLWDEYHPVIGKLQVRPFGTDDTAEVSFGLTDFHADKHQFTNHGIPVFLRGKHDGMIFPLTGAAPTTVEEWMKVMKTAKSYGINHYRFHTCCPPEAAFTAADLLGIYLEPEIPFWGTIAAPGEEGYQPQEQEYLIAEGKRILETFGNHPSFAMFSLGNELWGSPKRLGEMIAYYKQDEQRILFTQGCNNFQFWPNLLPEDDFFVGVRLNKERLIRGSYGMCDAPLGHVQSQRPSTMHHYDGMILPIASEMHNSQDAPDEIEIQYGTGVKKVHVDKASDGLIPDRPVVTHEIGQYCMYPNFKEIPKYKGILKARNFEIFQERLKEKGMLCQAEDFFLSSGKLAVQCYKEELEAAMRSKFIAGFQILDIQDFTGQGTALVGILDAFMDSKGLISPEKWRSFCSDSVILAQFPSYVLGDDFSASVSIRHYAKTPIHDPITYTIQRGQKLIKEGKLEVHIDGQGLFEIGTISAALPTASRDHKVKVTLQLPNTRNSYTLWQYPCKAMPELQSTDKLCITTAFTEMKSALENGKRVLYFPESVKESIPGCYCTDFWCYPMFRSISESMNKPVPVGTLGLCIQKEHPALKKFRCERWSTPQWYDIVTHADCAILDDTPLQAIVQMIDNFERNHKLGILFECNVGSGKLLVCTARLSEIQERTEAAQFARSLLEYAESPAFLPDVKLSAQQLEELFG